MLYGKEEKTMPRKKKIEEEQIEVVKDEYITCSMRTNLARISMKTGVPVEELRALNPDIRFGIIGIPAGRRVRIR